jgi:hypothetical protein
VADRLRAQIEASGWRVTDRGPDFALLPAHPPDIVERDRRRHGSSASVPSRLSEPPTTLATVAFCAVDVDVGPVLEAVRTYLAPDVQVVVVADDPSPEVAASLEAHGDAHPGLEVSWTSARLGPAAALNIAMRRSAGEIVIVLGPGALPAGDLVGPLAEVLRAPDVGVAGLDGLQGPDVRHLRPAPPGDVVALDGRCLATRRDLAAARGAVDERLATWPMLAIWWSLLLRDQGVGRPPLRGIAVAGLPIQSGPTEGRPTERRGTAESGGPPADDPKRPGRRDRYRLLDRFGDRPDLLSVPNAG